MTNSDQRLYYLCLASYLRSVLSVVLDGTRMERVGFDHRFCFVVVPLQIEENSQRKAG